MIEKLENNRAAGRRGFSLVYTFGGELFCETRNSNCIL